MRVSDGDAPESYHRTLRAPRDASAFRQPDGVSSGRASGRVDRRQDDGIGPKRGLDCRSGVRRRRDNPVRAVVLQHCRVCRHPFRQMHSCSAYCERQRGISAHQKLQFPTHTQTLKSSRDGDPVLGAEMPVDYGRPGRQARRNAPWFRRADGIGEEPEARQIS